MTEETGDGGYTGNADGAGYTGYDPGPDSSSADTPAPTPPPHEIYDPPIEHDPIGQAIIGLPAAALFGAGEVVIGGATVAAAAVKEGVAGVASEVGLYLADEAIEGPGEGSGGDGGAEGAGSE